MANYQKYMFDNFVVEDTKDKKVVVDDVPISSQNDEPDIDMDMEIESFDIIDETKVDNLPDSAIAENDNIIEQSEVTPITVEDLVVDNIEASDENISISEDVSTETEAIAEAPLIEPEVVEPQTIEQTYTIEEVQNAVSLAKDEIYKKASEEASKSITAKQNLLLEDIKSQLVAIHASMDQKKEELEEASVRFAVEVVGKILPSLEKERAEEEVRRFLVANFANFAAQETLSFSFNPETVNVVAECINRLAEQNDFEGKISVHKDSLLAPADCRVEWKSGGVERSSSNIMDKIKGLIDNNSIKERENG